MIFYGGYTVSGINSKLESLTTVEQWHDLDKYPGFVPNHANFTGDGFDFAFGF